MSIYVTLPSNGGGKEFGPTNHNSEYKIRLPERLKLLDEEWEVALASISLPTFDASNEAFSTSPRKRPKSGSKVICWRTKRMINRPILALIPLK